MGRGLGCLIVVAVVAAALFYFGRDYVRRHPQDFPWTKLDLDDPIGRFTAGKLAALGDEPARCRALLAGTAAGDEPAAPRRTTPDCGYDDGMRLAGRSAAYRPDGLITSCPVAAALHLWETRIVQPAARRHFATSVERINHSGSYSCRRISGSAEADFSEHATADAIDVTGFELANGQRVEVVEDWDGTGASAHFLRDVRDGACQLFTTVLSPDYNQAHRDHLHFDAARRGAGAWTFCR